MSNEFDENSLPKEWPEHVQSSIVHVIALARAAIVCARAKASNSPLAAAQLRAKLDNARAEISLLREELRIKDARMATLEARRRPHYRPIERQSIIELRAARGWSAGQDSPSLPCPARDHRELVQTCR